MVPMTSTEPATEPDATATPAPPAADGPRPPRRSPWPRRALIAVLLIGATAGLVWGSSRAETGLPKSDPDPAIVAQFPPPGAEALRQTSVGVQLADGYDGRLTVNGVAIPEADMEGVIPADSPEAGSYEGNELRPNNRNRVFFQPGPGKAVEELREGRNTITVRYFKEGRPETGRSVTWVINVT